MTPILRRKLIITGTGRAGTTFLVQLLTELGFETGFDRGSATASYHEHCHAGLEHDLHDPRAPYVVKNPNLCDALGGILDAGDIVIDHAIVPVRNLEDATRSRIQVGGDGRTPGGLTGTADAAEQQRVLAERFHRLIHALARHQVPTTFLEFPRFARDAAYTFAALRSVLPASLGWEDFAAAFARTSRPELIHQFSGPRSAEAGEPARQHAALRRAARAARHRRRWTAGCVVALTVGIAGWLKATRPDASAEWAAHEDGARPAWVRSVEDSSDRPAPTTVAPAGFARGSGQGSGMYLDPEPARSFRPAAPRMTRTPRTEPRVVRRFAATPRWL